MTRLHVPVEIDQGIFSLAGTAEDIVLVRNQGFDVDDDNKPVEENIPTADAPVPANNGLYEGQSWGWDGFDQRTNKEDTRSLPSPTTGHLRARATSSSSSTPSLTHG